MARNVVGGNLVFPIDRAGELMKAYADITAAAPAELYVDAIMSTPRGGKPGAFVFNTCYSGVPEQAEKALAPLRKLGQPLADQVRTVDYVSLQRSGDRTDPRNEGSYLKSGFIDAFPDRLVDTLLDGYQPHPDRATTVFFQHSGEAIGRVPVDATAFPHRRATHNMFATVTWPLAADAAQHVRYLKSYWDTLAPYTDGYYTNEVADEGQRVVDENYQGNLSRLQQVKSKYDPKNLFRLNANIKPTA
jgi:FAD/FMN-containing dehydrogenase